MKKKVLLSILVISIIFLTGCWSKRELNELSMVTAIGIDKNKNGYIVSAQVINPSEVAGETKSNRTSVVTYRTEGKTIFEGLRRLTLKFPRKLYVAHLRILVLGENLARDGISKVLDLFSRNHEVRTDFYILVAKNTEAEKVLDILTPTEEIPANKIYTALETSERVWAPTHAVKLDELIKDIISEGKNPILTGVILDGDHEVGTDIKNIQKVNVPTLLKIGSLGVFRGDKLVGWLNERESRGYNIIMGNVENSVLTIPWEDGGKLAIEVLRTKTKVRGKVKNGKPSIYIDNKAEFEVGEVACLIELTKTENIEKIEKILEKTTKERIREALRRAQKDFKSDIFGFGEAIHRADPKAWKELKKNWNEEFEKVPVNIKVTIDIKGMGTITESFQGKGKE